MADVTIRDLRNHGADVIDRVLAGEQLTITRDGRPVAVLSAAGDPPVPATELVARRALLPSVDPERLRDDIDSVVDMSL